MFVREEKSQMKGKRTRVVGIGLAIALVVATGGAPVSAEGILGQVNARQIEINGVQTPSHTTLLSSSTLETTDHPAIIHLGSGQTLSLAPHSQAHFEGSLEDGVGVSLRYGAIAYRDGGGELVQIADAGTFMLQQSGVQQGEPIGTAEAGVPLCSLKSGDIATCLDDPEDSSCDWEYIESVDYSDVDAYLNQGATFLTAENLDSYFAQPGKSSEGQTLVVYDCRDKKVAAIVAASGGLSAAAIAGIAFGSALGVVIIEDAASSDSGGGGVGVTVGTQITP